MKTGFRLMVLAFVMMAAAFVMAVSAHAADSWAGTGTDIGTTNCYYITSAFKGGTPRVQYLNATSDKAGSVITFFTPTATATATYATNASQAVVYLNNSATTFATHDCVVFRRQADDSYQRLTVTSATTTNVTFTQNLGASVALGDVFYKMAAGGTIACGAATKEINAAGGGIYNGKVDYPLLIDIDGTSACQVNCVGGIFEK